MKRSLDIARMNVRVGIMCLIAFAILVWILFFPVRGVSPFVSKMEVQGYYDRVDGLRRNAPVFYRGIEVGTVDTVDLTPDHPDAPLKVVILVEMRVVPLLPKTTVMHIVARGLLGDVFVDLETPPGATQGPTIAEGDTLATEDYASALSGMDGLGASLKDTVDELKTILARAEAGQGDLGHLIRDDQLYTEMVKTVQEIGQVSENIATLEDTINNKLLDPKTKQGIDNAVDTANRVLANADTLTAKADAVKWYMEAGADRYTQGFSDSYADLRIVPDKDKFYMGGIDFFAHNVPITTQEYSAGAGGYLGYDGFLGLRILNSPLFFRGGVKRTSVDAGIDFHVNELPAQLPIEFNADLNHYDLATPELDLTGSYTLFKMFRVSGGADDVLTTPFYRFGLTLIYDDEDLTSVLVKTMK